MQFIYPLIILKRSSSARSAACFLIWIREPLNRFRSTSKCLRLWTAINTSPTGFWDDPPVGPAMPLMATLKSVSNSFLTFLAMSPATDELTAPFFCIKEGGILSSLVLDVFE